MGEGLKRYNHDALKSNTIEEKPEAKIEVLSSVEKINKELAEQRQAETEQRVSDARQKIQAEGLKMRPLLETLRDNHFEGFSLSELNQIANILSYLILEIDPASQNFYISLNEQLKVRITQLEQQS